MATGPWRAAILGLLACTIGVAPSAGAQTSKKLTSGPYVQVSLREQLRMGLKCRRPIEFAFVDHVAYLVEHDELPLDLVNICFLWSRQQSRTIPWVYFERSLRELAKQKGYKI